MIDWHVVPFRVERWYRALASGRGPDARLRRLELDTYPVDRRPARSSASRASGSSREDFERYWYSDEIEAARTSIIDLYDKPLLPSWHTLLVAE